MSTTPVPRGHLAGSVAARVQQVAGAATGSLRRIAHPTRPADPAEALFRRIGWQLALRYAAVFAGLLLVAGLLLYVFFNNLLIGPIDPALKGSAQTLQQAWQQNPDRVPCGRPQAGAPYVVCYDSSGDILSGSFISGSPQAPGVNAFVDAGLFRHALAAPSATVCDTVDGGPGLGAIRRCAVTVVDSASGAAFGVVQVGLPIQGDLTALHLLVRLLLALGVLALIGAVLGGVALSRRALAPARLALQRQQAFIGDAAHELRTPLALARANAELLLHSREKLDPEDAELLEDIVAEIGHMGALATSMLRLARLDEGREGSPEREVVDLGELARALARRAESLAAERDLALSVEAEPDVLVLGDCTQLEEVALILLDNAIKYNRPGGAVRLEAAREGGRALLSVADSGPGIAAEHLARLGERFYRVDKSRSRELGGAGLGLSIARRIIAAHDGTLAFASQPGEGTRVTLSLPAAA